MAYLRLFDVEDGVLTPSESCYAIKSLKEVMEAFPDNYLKIYLYLFYSNCLDPERNPFYNISEDEKEELILKEVKADFSTDDPVITRAFEFCKKAYTTPSRGSYLNAKTALERLGNFLRDTHITTGRDGNGIFIRDTLSKYDELWESFMGREKQYLEEIAQTRGGSFVAYDQR